MIYRPGQVFYLLSSFFAIPFLIVGFTYLINGCNPGAGACSNYAIKDGILLSKTVIQDITDLGSRSSNGCGLVIFGYDGSLQNTSSLSLNDGNATLIYTEEYIGYQCQLALLESCYSQSDTQTALNGIGNIGDNITIYVNNMNKKHCITLEVGYYNWMVGVVCICIAILPALVIITCHLIAEEKNPRCVLTHSRQEERSTAYRSV